MTLEEIARTRSHADALRVPEWALGTVVRRSISFATGVVDDATRVVWVQAHGMTGDIRIHPARPLIDSGAPLESLERSTLSWLASVEGGIATTSWDEPVMSWADWIGFQPYDKYPEPGIMRRIGGCMIEFAPSGIYVEDWRFQPSSPGLLAGLRLVAEIGDDGRERPRAGGLVIAGDHAILSVARRDELPDGTRAQDFVRDSADPVAALERVFDCTVDYLVKADGVFRVALSTDPRREGATLPLIDGFTHTSETGVLRQAVSGVPSVTARLWRIDSLEAGREFSQSTAVTDDRLAWLAAEADTLLDPLSAHSPPASSAPHTPSEALPRCA